MEKLHFGVKTPAMVFDQAEIGRCAERLVSAVKPLGVQILYALKACHVAPVLEQLVRYVDGVSVSSMWEAMLARQYCGRDHSIHHTSPGLRESDVDQFAPLYDYVSCNSVGQLRRLQALLTGQAKIGIRINPGVSFAGDSRYDPCCDNSKLGVSYEELIRLFDNLTETAHLSGLLFHNNCDSNDLSQLLATVRAIEKRLGHVLPALDWINIGGGYLFGERDDLGAFAETVSLLRCKYNLNVFVEPGAAFVRSSASLISTVVDIFESDGKVVAILDTTVNHLPEVFEYQYEPDVREHVDAGTYEYALVGCSCLAGDVFGDYSFNDPLELGSQITFENVGAYSLVKAHMFNGISLPSIYVMDEDGSLELVKEFTFEDFANQCGFPSYQYANH